MYLKDFFLKLTISVTTLYAFSLPGQAADSRWLLCDNGNLALNLLEHRSADGQGRATALTLLLGANVFSGQLNNADAGKVILSSLARNQGSFRGDVAVNHQKKLASLNGTLTLSGNLFNIRTQLKCKEMRSAL